MRPEILKLQAFGPYVKQQCINFHVFDEQHLFLIQGRQEAERRCCWMR